MVPTCVALAGGGGWCLNLWRWQMIDAHVCGGGSWVRLADNVCGDSSWKFLVSTCLAVLIGGDWCPRVAVTIGCD